jgi:putative membrane protein insertion efficiency factor
MCGSHKPDAGLVGRRRHFVRLLHYIYKSTLSPLLGNVCRFSPSCSDYALEALEKYGYGKGGYISLKRVLRCHPWNPGGIDPVP